MRLFFIFTLLLLSATNLYSDTLFELLKDNKIHLHGLGQIKIGMRVEEIEEISGLKLYGDPYPDPQDNYCEFYYFKDFSKDNSNKNIAFMVTGKNKKIARMSRIYLRSSQFETLSGIRVGDSIEKLKSVYPKKLKETKNHYTSQAEFLFVPTSKTENYRIVFETNGNNIISISIGKTPEIFLVEGCS